MAKGLDSRFAMLERKLDQIRATHQPAAQVLAFGRYFVAAGTIRMQDIPGQPEALSLIVDAEGMTQDERNQAFGVCGRLEELIQDHLEAAGVSRPKDHQGLLELVEALRRAGR